ncbi:MAG: biotin-dependent carboxyltransferase family protein [Spirochaetales bacterium]
MNKPITLRVLDPGLFSTVQDLGRWGHQAVGVSPSGVMDEYAATLTNLLVGNSPQAPLLEMTLKGATVQFEEGGWVAIGGAECGATLDGKQVSNWSVFYAPQGATLRLGFVQDGCRMYLAIAGGIDVPLILGSASTYLRAGFGGLEGRKLQEGDVLKGRIAPLHQQTEGKYLEGTQSSFLKEESFVEGTKALNLPEEHNIPQQFNLAQTPWLLPSKTLNLPASQVPRYGGPLLLRVLLGPQEDHFTEAGIHTFFHSTYTISHEADRMGYRLEGPIIEHRGKADILSDALARGSIQVPGHGKPIVMMADHQTTGGYPKIGTVIQADQYLLAQGKPGDEVRFFPATEEEALAALIERKAKLTLVQKFLQEVYRCSGLT